MANFSYQGTVDGVQPTEQEFDVASGTTASISVGDIVTIANGYAAFTADDGCTTDGLHGLAVEDSDETTTAAGKVKVLYSTSGLKLRGVPNTASNLATAILFDRVTIDVSSTTQTVDEDDAGGGICTITGYDSTNGTIDIVLAATL